MSNGNSVTKKIAEKFGNAITNTHSFRNDETLFVQKEHIIDIIKFLKYDKGFLYNFLVDLTAVDLGVDKNPRFEVVYHLYSLDFNHRLRIKAPLYMGDFVIDSITEFYKVANWYEREVWDMFGIKFNGHPDLKRILLYEEFVGHPLKKDYPIDREQPIVKLKN
jgi:NADH-quinone oxidoreductase subunit C